MDKRTPAKKTKRTKAPDRVLQLEDFTPAQRRTAQAIWRDQGNVKSHLDQARRLVESKIGSANAHQRIQGKHLQSSLAQVAPHFTNRPITLEGATQARVQLLHDAVERSHQDPQASAGGWYYQHHTALAASGAAARLGPVESIRSATSLSAQNAPETERAAAAGVHDLVGNEGAHTFHLTPTWHAAASAAAVKLGGDPIPARHVGAVVRAQELSPQQLVGLVNTSKGEEAEGRPAESSVDMRAIRSARNGRMVANSIAYLRGSLPEEALVNPHSAPKIASYTQATLDAAPNTPEHDEYMHRVHHLLHQDPNQGAFDLWGLRQSHAGLLSADHDTAEDSWMQAVSTGQPLAKVPGSRGRGVSPAKFAASVAGLADPSKAPKRSRLGVTVHPDPRVGGVTAVHALNNAATRQAAAAVPVRMGETVTHLPAVAAQEVVWTEARRQAGKAYDYQDPHSSSSTPKGAAARLSSQQFRGQGKLEGV